MLKIQRASAGSGKTYALAKTFILNLIAYENSEGKWILRNIRQMEDALSHLLAITFTNKATNEMKKRIVENLSALSKVSSISALNEEALGKIPYLKDFQGLLGATYEELGIAAGNALDVILNNYSLFKISTIDSFFQELLRTFAYETNINESYQLEIDSNFVTDAALTEAMNELDNHLDKMGYAKIWLQAIIRNEALNSQRWNPFNKSGSTQSVYSRLRQTLMKLEKEDYKDIKEQLEVYFKEPNASGKIHELYNTLQERAIKERKNLLNKIVESRKRILNYVEKSSRPKEHYYKLFLDHIDKIKDIDINSTYTFKFDKFLKEKSVIQKKYRTSKDPIDLEAMNFYGYIEEWNSPAIMSDFTIWRTYGSLIPFLGLIIEIKTFLSEVLQSNNLIQISDTPFILKKIIGDEDSPFIYERLGNKIEQYLIDEFQDTSQMQWDIIHPLLAESESKGGNSLIIGDPKQSIYRFRNANHALITDVVPNSFPLHLSGGYSIEDNTNWRSHTKIVKFNNFLFKNLSGILYEISKKKGLGTDFKSLYSNVVQYPSNQEGNGFIEIRLYEKSKEKKFDCNEDSETTGETEDNSFVKYALDNIGPLLSSLMERGYRQKDIAILVDTNDKGRQVVESLINYNESISKIDTMLELEDAQRRKIDFISEESLSISSSRAVEIIIGIIEKLVNPSNLLKVIKKENEGTSDNEMEFKSNGLKRRRYFNWNNLKIEYAIFSLQNKERPAIEKIMAFLEEAGMDKALPELIETLPTPSITSLIEAITDTFLDQELKKSESIYISALQDLVNEFSGSHHNDPVSFLEWWYSRGNRASVNSPEGKDAVQIMTIHKSKGLEFKCVIVPFATDSFVPSPKKEEWRWVKPDIPAFQDLPPFVPVKTTSQLTNSVHADIFKEYFDQILTDKINMYYVALTRAKNELYIFTKKPSKTGYTFQDFILQIVEEENVSENITEEESESLITIEDINWNKEKNVIKIGTQLSREDIVKELSKDDEKEEKNGTHYISDYYINKKRPKLRSAASTLKPSGEN